MNNSVHTLQESLTTHADMANSPSSDQSSSTPTDRSFRQRILTVDRSNGPDNDANRKENILAKRGVFKWLHVAFDNDIVYGSWYFVWGSFLCMIIPVFPLASIFEEFFDSGSDDVGGGAYMRYQIMNYFCFLNSFQ